MSLLFGPTAAEDCEFLCLTCSAFCQHFSSQALHAQECSEHLPSYEMLDIYSALRDPTNGNVRLFFEYYPKHHSLMSEEEKKKGPDFQETFAGCLFSDREDFPDSTEVAATDVRARPHGQHAAGNRHIPECAGCAHPRYASGLCTPRRCTTWRRTATLDGLRDGAATPLRAHAAQER